MSPLPDLPGSGPAVVYHGSHERVLSREPRPVLSYHSLGTWFSSLPAGARLYGREVAAFHLPPGKLLDLDVAASRQHQDFYATLAGDSDLARSAGHPREAAILARVRPDSYRHQELSRKLEKEGLSELEAREMKGLRGAIEAARTLLKSAAYMQAFRARLEAQGYSGIVWRNSTIDYPGVRDPNRPPAPHDVYVLFHRERLTPRAHLSMEPEPALARKLESKKVGESVDSANTAPLPDSALSAAKARS